VVIEQVRTDKGRLRGEGWGPAEPGPSPDSPQASEAAFFRAFGAASLADGPEPGVGAEEDAGTVRTMLWQRMDR